MYRERYHRRAAIAVARREGRSTLIAGQALEMTSNRIGYVSIRLIIDRLSSCRLVHANRETPAQMAQIGTSQHQLDVPGSAFG